jgi:type VII secretion integral membrane protein EccD
MNTTDESCRVPIRAGDREADLTVPAHLPVRELLPAIVGATGYPDFSGRDLRLTRACGGPIDPGMTLAQSGVADGELLILTPVVAPAPRPRLDECAAVTEAVGAITRPWGPTAHHTATWVVVWWTAALLAVLLGRPVFDGHAARQPVVTGVAAAVVLAGAVVVQRRDHRVTGVTALGVLAAALAGLSGLLADPGLAGFALATSAVASASLLAWRVLSCAPAVFLPLSGVTMAASAAAVGAVAGWWSLSAAGPMLATGALIVLGSAPRLAVRSSGLGSSDAPDTGQYSRAVTAYHRLDLLVVTAAAATAAGAGITVATTSRPAVAAAFVAAVGAALLVRLRGHRDPYRFAVIAVSSGVAATSLVVLSAIAAPRTTAWLSGVLLAVAAMAGCLGGRSPRGLSPAARRAVAVLDIAVTTAVVPLAAAAGGAFTALREVALP